MAAAAKMGVDDLFEYIFRVKLAYSRRAEEYRRDPGTTVENIMLAKYGYYTTYKYEPFRLDPFESSEQLFLSVLIAETALLFKARGMLSNLTISIVGSGGAGKTTYAVMSSIGALRLLNKVYGSYTDDRIRLMATELTFFEPYSMVKTIHDILQKRLWTPFFIIDDIGSQISKYWTLLGHHHWVYLFSVLDQVKDWVGALITTARSIRSIPARINDITDIVVEARRVVTEHGVIADVFEYYHYDDYMSSTSRKSRLKKIMYVDVKPPTMLIPDEIWSRMMQTRRTMGLKRIGLVAKALEMLEKLEPELVASAIKKAKSIEKVIKEASGD